MKTDDEIREKIKNVYSIKDFKYDIVMDDIFDQVRERERQRVEELKTWYYRYGSKLTRVEVRKKIEEIFGDEKK